MEALKCAQDSWSQSLISEEDLCDAVALVGPQRHRVPFHRAPVAIVSKPLRAALYGDFKEGHTRELVLKDVTLEAFDVVIRSAYRLDIKLDPGRALQAMKAAKLYMIESLEQYCLEYLRDIQKWDCGQVLHIVTECLKESISLPEEMQHIYFRHILTNSSAILQSSFFLEAHGSIIASLIKLDEFNVNEETLWNRLVEWSSHAVEKPELLGPFASVTPPVSSKRAKSDTDSNSGGHQAAQQEAILCMMSRDMRFASITKDFFVDKIRKYMSREESEAIIDFYLLGRKSSAMPASIWNQRVGVGLERSFTKKEIAGTEITITDAAYPVIPKGWGKGRERQRQIQLQKPECITCVECEFQGWLDHQAAERCSVLTSLGRPFLDLTLLRVGGPQRTTILRFDLDGRGSCDRLHLRFGDFPLQAVRIYAKVALLECDKGTIEQLCRNVLGQSLTP